MKEVEKLDSQSVWILDIVPTLLLATHPFEILSGGSVSGQSDDKEHFYATATVSLHQLSAALQRRVGPSIIGEKRPSCIRRYNSKQADVQWLSCMKGV